MRRLIGLFAFTWLASLAGAPAVAQEPAGGARPTLDYDFFKAKVQPVFAEKRPGYARCISCHKDFPITGFHLEPPDANGKWTEEQSRANFTSASRRVVPGAPMRSKLLRHPLREISGGDHYHHGGKHWESPNEPGWQALSQWVLGAKVGTNPAP